MVFSFLFSFLRALSEPNLQESGEKKETIPFFFIPMNHYGLVQFVTLP